MIFWTSWQMGDKHEISWVLFNRKHHAGSTHSCGKFSWHFNLIFISCLRSKGYLLSMPWSWSLSYNYVNCWLQEDSSLCLPSGLEKWVSIFLYAATSLDMTWNVIRVVSAVVSGPFSDWLKSNYLWCKHFSTMLLSVVYTVVIFLSRCRVTQATNT